MSIDVNELKGVVISGVDHRDYPDFTDAFIESAEYNGKLLTEEQLVTIGEDSPEFVQEQAMMQAIGASQKDQKVLKILLGLLFPQQSE